MSWIHDWFVGSEIDLGIAVAVVVVVATFVAEANTQVRALKI